MTDDEIRELLSGIRGDPEGQPEGHIAIFEHTIQDRGPDNLDLDAILRWVEDKGGFQRLQPRHERIRSGRRTDEMERYFSVPESALITPAD